MLKILGHPGEILERFRSWADWAEKIDFATAFLDPGPPENPAWLALRDHLKKIDRAYVGLDLCRTSPVALQTLRESCRGLRIVRRTDGSFRRNVYLFQRDRQIRVLLGDLALEPLNFSRGAPTVVAFEGDLSNPQAIEARALLEDCRGLAELPSSQLLKEYGPRSGHAQRDLNAHRFVDRVSSLRRFDARSLRELRIVEDEERILGYVTALEQELDVAATNTQNLRLNLLGSTGKAKITWFEDLGVWTSIRRETGRVGFALGIGQPDPARLNQGVLDLSLDTRGYVPRLSGLFCEDSTGRAHLCHTGQLRNLSEAFWQKFHDGIPARRPSGEEVQVLVLTPLGVPDLAANLAAFVHEGAELRS